MLPPLTDLTLFYGTYIPTVMRDALDRVGIHLMLHQTQFNSTGEHYLYPNSNESIYITDRVHQVHERELN